MALLSPEVPFARTFQTKLLMCRVQRIIPPFPPAIKIPTAEKVFSSTMSWTLFCAISVLETARSPEVVSDQPLKAWEIPNLS